jgi:hypothetical protein
MLRLAVTARGLNKLVIAKPQNLRMAQAMYMNQNTLVSAQMVSEYLFKFIVYFSIEILRQKEEGWQEVRRGYYH